MGIISDAVSLQRISTVVGYKLTTGDFSETSPNLPQRIAILAEANTANQSNLNTEKKQIITAQEAGELYGWGSPIHMIARILLPVNGGGVDGIPVVVYPQAQAVGATAKILEVNPSGTATGNGTHTLVIAGRKDVDSSFYNINIVAGDTPSIISGKIADAVNNVLGGPMTGDDDAYGANLTSKWKGLTANELNVHVDTGDDNLGITYVVQNVQNASGVPSVQGALDQFGNEWITLVVNSYGTHEQTMRTLEIFNGFPFPDNPTGRFRAIMQKPFIAITGTVAEDPSSISDARPNECTIAFAPAPLSLGLSLEAAANMCLEHATIAHNTPHLDVMHRSYKDMPVPASIGKMSIYDYRDQFVNKGCSTVDLDHGVYVIQDFVTTYHKSGENPPQFRYVRDLVVDTNIRYGYFILEQLYLVGHVIANDFDIVKAEKVVKPKTWKQQVFEYAVDLTSRALTVDAAFMQNGTRVGIGTGNQNRMDTFFPYKRSGVARISSTTSQAGFSFGQV